MSIKVGDYIKKVRKNHFRIYHIIDITNTNGISGIIIASNYKVVFKKGNIIRQIRPYGYEKLSRNEVIMELL